MSISATCAIMATPLSLVNLVVTGIGLMVQVKRRINAGVMCRQVLMLHGKTPLLIMPKSETSRHAIGQSTRNLQIQAVYTGMPILLAQMNLVGVLGHPSIIAEWSC